MSVTAGHHRFCCEKVLLAQGARSDLLAHPPHIGGGAEGAARQPTGEHRATGHHDGGKVDRCSTHHHGRGRLVAPGQQHHAVDRVATNRLLDVHRHQVPQQHRGRLDLGLAERHHRELERHTARLPHPAFDVFDQFVEVLIARCQFRCRIADPDHRPTREHIVGQAPLHPAAMDVVVATLPSVPMRGSKLDGCALDGHQSTTHGLVNSPIPSIQTVITSPLPMYRGGLRANPTPSGVPVAITSPGSRVMNRAT